MRDWNIQGLPSDAFSTENGVVITRGNRSAHRKHFGPQRSLKLEMLLGFSVFLCLDLVVGHFENMSHAVNKS